MAGTLATGERQVVPSEVFRQEELYEGILYILSDGCVREYSGNVEEGGRLPATECRHHIFIADDADDVRCFGPTRQRTMGYHRTIASLCTLPFKVVVEHRGWSVERKQPCSKQLSFETQRSTLIFIHRFLAPLRGIEGHNGSNRATSVYRICHEGAPHGCAATLRAMACQHGQTEGLEPIYRPHGSALRTRAALHTALYRSETRVCTGCFACFPQGNVTQAHHADGG